MKYGFLRKKSSCWECNQKRLLLIIDLEGLLCKKCFK